MSGTIEIDGSSFVTVKEASKQVSYSRDYVARLAREQKIVASQVGRQWFVDIVSLKNFAEVAELEQQIRKKKLSDRRRNDLRLKEDVKKFRESFAVRRSQRDLRAIASTALVLCLGIFSGLALYNSHADVFSNSTVSANISAITDVVRSSQNEVMVLKDDISPKQNVYLDYEQIDAMLVSSDALDPLFVDESEVRPMKNTEEGIFLLSKEGEVRTAEQVEALFSDEVSVEFTSENEGVVWFDNGSEVREFPFVSVPASEVVEDGVSKPNTSS